MQVGGHHGAEEFWQRIAASEQEFRDAPFRMTAWRIADWSGPVMLGTAQFDGSVLGLTHLLDASDPRDAARIAVDRSTSPARDATILPWRIGAADVDDPWSVPAPDGQLGLTTPVGPLTATVWRNGTREWFAVAQLPDGTSCSLHAEGVGPDAFTLVEVDDLEPLIAARHAWIAALRGEAPTT